jgi:protease I
MQLHQSAELLRVDKAVQSASAADYDGLFIPGGYISPDLLRQSAPARAFVRAFDTAGKPIAALSQAPLVLASSGLAKGRTLTSWPGVRDDMVHAGATWLNQAAVRDGHYLFGRGPQDVDVVASEMVALFAGQPASSAARPDQSDPPQQEPSETADQGLRWLSAPSVGAMLSLALLGVGVVAANRGRKKRQAADEPPDEPAPESA